MDWPTKLRALADWIDLKHPGYESDEVQRDLRKLADELKYALRVVPVGEPVKASTLRPGRSFVCDYPGVWRASSWHTMRINNVSTGESSALAPGAIVQPVRLEPWEVEG